MGLYPTYRINKTRWNDRENVMDSCMWLLLPELVGLGACLTRSERSSMHQTLLHFTYFVYAIFCASNEF